jgi:flagellar protein FlaG
MSTTDRRVALGKVDMVISSLQSNVSSPQTQPQPSVEQAAETRQLMQAAKSVNDSGVLGQNQLVFIMDRQTHRPVFRVVDRTTHQVISQIPAEYVLRLAQNLGSNLAQLMASGADT